MKKRDNKAKASRGGLKVVRDAPGNGGGDNDGEGGGIDFEAVRALARIAAEFDLAEVEVDRSGLIRVRRPEAGLAAPAAGAPRAPIALSPTPPVDGAAEGAGTFISSPFVGTFYGSPSPEAPSFVEVGQNVRKGQVVCIVEAMKLMNEIESEAEGKIVEILVKNGEHIEYGQHLFRLAKS
jgi:acetyl-CoA carboxylase biotin carboxyl carrier protein